MTLFRLSTPVRFMRPLLHGSCIFLLMMAAMYSARAQDNALPSPWRSEVVGDVSPVGAASFSSGAFTVSAAGADITAGSDNFRFVDQTVTGNTTVTARIASLNGPHEWSKAGVMIRAGSGTDVNNILLAVTPAHGITFQRRDVTGGDTTATAISDTASVPIWLRLQRVGHLVSGFTSSDGIAWSPAGTVELPLTPTISVGLAFTSHQDGTLGSAVFDSVTVTHDPASIYPETRFNITADAVDPSTFHLVAAPVRNPVPPVSPFVVETTPYPGAMIHRAVGDISVSTHQGALIVHQQSARLLDKVGHALLPSLSYSESDDYITLILHHAPNERLYGAGNQSRDHAGDLTHPAGTQIVGNGVTRIPFLWSTGGWSLFLGSDRTGAAWQDDNGTLTITMPGPDLDLYLSVADNSYGLLSAYSRLTGHAPIPPRWTFGFMLSRWGYTDATDVQDKWHQFRDRQIPIDSFEYDYDWFVNDWDFNPNTFPAGSLDKMHSMGLKFVGIRKPRVNGDNLQYASTQGWTLNSPLGIDLHFDLPTASYWWWGHQSPLVRAGVDGWWNDEAEQTVDEFFQMAKTEWTGWRAMNTNRAWSINRAFAPGMQRFGAAVWTGDIDSDWATLAQQPGTMLNWGMAGMPYTGQDIGGFQSTPSPELYARWMEEGVFVPVMRAHGTYNSPRWPWAFGAESQEAATDAIDERYRLIPYIYTFAAQTAASGVPIMRPLFLEFPQDEQTFNLRDEWLIGDRLLAAPVLTEGGARDVYLPAGYWFDFNTNAPITGGQTLHLQVPLNTIPAYIRAGTILPLGPVIQSTSLGVEDPLEIRVYPGADASFTLYEDDGHTYAYQHGSFSLIPMRWTNRTQTLTIGNRVGTFSGMMTTHHLNIVLPNGTHKTVTYQGRALSVTL